MGHSNSPPACCMTCSYKPGRRRPVSLHVLAICVMLCCIVALGRNNQALSVSIFTGCHESREESICTYWLALSQGPKVQGLDGWMG